MSLKIMKSMLFACGLLFVTACSTSQINNDGKKNGENIITNSDTPVPQGISSTSTSIPETATILPNPAPGLEIFDTVSEVDQCTNIAFNPDSWGSISVGYTGGDDPYFQVHSEAGEFFFNLELYSQYGAGWTGQTGSFEPTCNTNGICAYFLPDSENIYLANAGEIIIGSLIQEGGNVQPPLQLTLNNITFAPYPGSDAPGCYHMDTLSFNLE